MAKNTQLKSNYMSLTLTEGACDMNCDVATHCRIEKDMTVLAYALLDEY